MLYHMGANIVLLARNKSKAEVLIKELKSGNKKGEIQFELCDLSSMQNVTECSERILEKNEKINILINCAGINSTDKSITEEGFELNWAVNYLGPYILTSKLLNRIAKSKNSRIINITTDTDFINKIDLNELESVPNFLTNETYVESKLALNMFSIDLANKYEDKGMVVNYLYPGYIKSNLLRHLEGGVSMMRFFMDKMASPTEVGSDRIVRLAISSEYESINGKYIYEDEIQPHHSEAEITEKRNKLKQITEKVLQKWLN